MYSVTHYDGPTQHRLHHAPGWFVMSYLDTGMLRQPKLACLASMHAPAAKKYRDAISAVHTMLIALSVTAADWLELS